MNTELSNTFYEVQAEKFYQKKVEVARGVIELGQILIETKAKLPHGSWIKWLEDERVNFTDRTARNYMERTKFYNSECDRLKLDKTETCFHFEDVLNEITHREFQTLKSAPEEVKEDVANSKDKEEAEKKIKEYERKLKEKDGEIEKLKQEKDQEKLANEALIKNCQKLEEQNKTAKEEGFKEGKQAKIDEEKSTMDKQYSERYKNEVASKTSTIRQEYQKRLDELGSALDSTIEELDHYKDVLYKDKEVNREYQRLEEKSKKLKRKIDELEQWGTLEANLDLAIAQATALITGDIGTNENDNEALILSISRTVNRLRKITKLLEDNFDIIGETTIYKEDGIEIIDVEGI